MKFFAIISFGATTDQTGYKGYFDEYVLQRVPLRCVTNACVWPLLSFITQVLSVQVFGCCWYPDLPLGSVLDRHLHVHSSSQDSGVLAPCTQSVHLLLPIVCLNCIC